jgi:hypothetical protein
MRLSSWLLWGPLVAGCAARPAASPARNDAAIADTVRAESQRMVEAMRARKIDEVLAFYGKRTAYVGNGEIGDWDAIVAAAPPRYATYTRVDCSWPEPFRVDVLGPTVAVVTGVLDCQKADTSGRAWREITARTEVLAPEDGRWRIVAVHESTPPGSGPLK